MTSTTLVINCSPAAERSVSRLLLEDLLRQRRKTHPFDRVVVRDLAAMGAALPHVDGVFSQAIFVPPAQRSAEQQQGLLTGKKGILLCATGGVFSTGARTTEDFLVPYLRQILGFMGLTDVDVYRAEGLAQDRDGAVKSARDHLAAANGMS